MVEASLIVGGSENDAEITQIVPSLPVVTAVLSPVSSAALHEAFARFIDLDVADGRATADTIAAYFNTIRSFLRWCGEQSVAPADVTPDEVKLYRAFLRDEEYAVSTIAMHLSIVRRFYDAALAYGLVESNPAKGIKAGFDPSSPEEKMKALTESGLRELLRTIDGNDIQGKRDRAIIGLMVMHGLRRVEVERLDHESLDGGDWIGSKPLGEGEPSGEAEPPKLRIHGKRGKFRTVYLRGDVARAWSEYVSAKAAAGLPLVGAMFVCHSNRAIGKRLSRRMLNYIVDQYLSEANLKRAGASCHALRHTFGTLSVAGGAKIEHVQSAMGHDSMDTTMLYVKAVEKKANNPANFIGPGLFGD